MLARWAQFAPGSRMPDDLSQLPLSQQVALEQADGELFALLGNTANAETELAALNNTLAAAPITPEERQQQANAERVAELLAMAPAGRVGRYEGDQYIPPTAPNVTALMELEALDPIAAQREQLQAMAPQQGNGLSTEDAQWVREEMERARQESAEIAYSGGGY